VSELTTGPYPNPVQAMHSPSFSSIPILQYPVYPIFPILSLPVRFIRKNGRLVQ